METLKSELSKGRKQEAQGKAEVESLKKRYEDVWNDKVMLAEQLSVSRVFLSGLMMDAES